jgi:hypothetical protein
MPVQNTVGKPFPRAFDPVIARVQPNGTQPQTVYAPWVVFANQEDYEVFLPTPPDFLTLQVLFFGSDYPIKVTGTQQYGSDTYFTDGTLNPVTDQSFPIATTAPFGGAVPVVPDIVTSAVPVAYQQILRDVTLTNGLRVSGFPYVVNVPSHSLFNDDSGASGERAGFGLALDVTLNSACNAGPGSFNEVVFGESITAIRVPVILWEPDFTQAVVDASYTITTTLFGIDAILDVVGLWASDTYSPVPAVGAKLLGAEPAPAPFAALADLRKRAFSK